MKNLYVKPELKPLITGSIFLVSILLAGNLQAQQISVNASANNLSGCNTNDGSISVNPSGGDGTGYYNIYLYNSGNSLVSSQNDVTSCSFSNLSPDTYSVSVEDYDNPSDGYANTQSSLTVNNGSCGTTISASTCGTTNESCPGSNDGTLTVCMSGGDGSNNFQGYLYDNYGTYYYAGPTSGGTSMTFTGLPASRYYSYAYVYDANSPNDGYGSYDYINAYSIGDNNNVCPTTISASGCGTTNESCPGSNDGTLTVCMSGGDGSNNFYGYLYDNYGQYYYAGPTYGGTSMTFTGLAASHYYNYVYVYDYNNSGDGYATYYYINGYPISDNSNYCATTISASVYSYTNESCPGSNDGSITLSVSGGDGSNYYYAVAYNYGSSTYTSSSQNGPYITISGLPSGDYYYIYVYDANNSGDGWSTEISPYQSIGDNSSYCATTISASVYSSTNESCPGSYDGSITLSVSGGDGSNYYYAVAYNYGSTTYTSSNQNGPYITISGLPAGDYYYIYVYDANNSADGWSTSISPYQSIGDNSSYCATTISASGCGTTNESCPGSNDGTLTVCMSGGDGSNNFYGYLYDNYGQYYYAGPTYGGTSMTFTGLPAAPYYYYAYVYDYNNSGDGYATYYYINGYPISDNSSYCATTISASGCGTTNESCPGSNDGTLTVCMSGGDGSNNFYGYLYDNYGQYYYAGPTYSGTSMTFTGLAASHYYNYVYVYDYNNSGDGYATYYYINGYPIGDNNSYCGSTISASGCGTTNESCPGSNDGTLTVCMSGGDGSNNFYGYLYNNYGQYYYAGPTYGGTSMTFTGLPAAPYYYYAYVYDYNNSGDGYATYYNINGYPIGDNNNYCGSTISASVYSYTNESCPGSNDGSITLSVSGGDGNNYYYAVAYNYGSSTYTSSSQNGPYITISGLPSGDYYYIYVYDANNSGDGWSTEISPYQSIGDNNSSCGSSIYSYVSSSMNESCPGSNDGSITLYVSGGDGNNYYYAVAYDYGSTTYTSSNQNGPYITISGLPAGDYYYIYVYDANNSGDGWADYLSPYYSISDNTNYCPTQIQISPSETDASCSNSNGSISISASGGDGNNYYYFYIYNNNTGYSNSTTTYSSTTFSGIPPGDYSITVDDGYNTSDGYGNSSSITVNDNTTFGDLGQYVAPSITEDGGYAPACIGSQPGYICDQYEYYYPGNWTYNWSVDASGGYISSTNNDFVSVTWQNSGTYDIDVTVTDDLGCTASTSSSFYVGGGAPAITPSAGACTNSTVTYSTSPDDENYAWSSDGSVSLSNSGAYQQQVTYNPGTAGQTGNIYLSVTDQNGCFSTGSTSVTVYDPASGQITGPGSTCANQTPYSYSTDAGGSNYVWTVDGNLGSSNGSVTAGQGTNDASVAWTTDGGTGSGSGYLAVTFTDVNGCYVNPGPQAFQITEVPLSNPNIDHAPTSVCAHSVAIYHSDAGYNTYQWTVDNNAHILSGGSTSDDSIVVSWATSGTGTVSVAHDNGSGCSGNASSITVTIDALPVPAAPVANEAAICSYDSAHISEPGSYRSYLWSNGGTGSTIATNQAGEYNVTVTDANGCTGASGQQQITVYPLSTVTISRDIDTLSTSNFISYQWLLNDNAISGATSAFYVTNQSGEYTVQVVDGNGCNATSSSYDYITGINQLSGTGLLNAYPDPFANVIFISGSSADMNIQTIDIYNVLGEKLVSKKAGDLNVANLSIDVSTLASGAYFIAVKTTTTQYLKKMIKE